MSFPIRTFSTHTNPSFPREASTVLPAESSNDGFSVIKTRTLTIRIILTDPRELNLGCNRSNEIDVQHVVTLEKIVSLESNGVNLKILCHNRSVLGELQMQFGLVVASVVIGLAGASPVRNSNGTTPVQRIYQWFMVPGGGICAMPTPFVVLMPVSKSDVQKLARSPRLRQELHIIIETDSVGHTELITKALIESVRQAVECTVDIAEQPETISTTKTSACTSGPSDPKQVIDPVVTGF